MADWASDEARELAEANSLTVEDMTGEGSGANGNYTVADVRERIGPSEEDGTGIRVRPHPAAGARVVVPSTSEAQQGDGPEGEETVIEPGSTISRSLFDRLQQKENHARPTWKYPEGYPLVVEYEEGS